MSQVLITGAAKRIGRSLAVALAKSGHDIAVHFHHSVQEAEELVTVLTNMGVTASAYRSDLTDSDACEVMMDVVMQDFPKLDTIINSASLFENGTLRSSTTDAFIDNYLIHVVSPLKMLQRFTRKMPRGVIINMLDCHITTNRNERAPYLLAKKTLAEVTKMAALEYAPHFRVNGISPGYVLDPNDDNKKFTKDMNPLEKQVSLTNIISTVQFLMANTDITGQIITVDGGAQI